MQNRVHKPTFVTALAQAAGRVPTPTAGLALGIASLGWLLENFARTGGIAQATGALVASVLLFGVVAKFLLHPSLVLQEMRHPVLGSILPTLAMGSMVISKAIGMQAPVAGGIIWLAAIALHLFFLAGFILCHIRAFRFNVMVPSWFVPPVGIITAALTCPGGGFAPFASGLLVFGLCSFALLLPLMLYRLIFHAEIADAAKPTIAILAAPASLSLAGYLSLAQNPSLVLVTALLGLALLLTALIYICLLRLLCLPFSPAYASFTFPLVISATALFKTMDLFAATPLTTEYAHLLRTIATTELVVAVCVVAYVTALYLRAGSKALLCGVKGGSRDCVPIDAAPAPEASLRGAFPWRRG